MSRKRKIIFASPERKIEDEEAASFDRTFDWNICFLCQEENSEQLLCLADGKHLLNDPEKIRDAYRDFAVQVEKFMNEELLPIGSCLEKLPTEGLGMILDTNRAKHHKKCKLKFSESKYLKCKMKKETEKKVCLTITTVYTNFHNRPFYTLNYKFYIIILICADYEWTQ